MSKGTVFNYLRYLALSAAEKRPPKLSKEELREKLSQEKFIFDGNNLDCAHILYLKYFDEYKTELEYSSKFV